MSPMWDLCSAHTWASPIGTYVKWVAKRSWVPCGQPMWDPQSSPQMTQLVPSSSTLKAHLKRDKTHMSPMWDPCSAHTWASPIGTYVKWMAKRSWVPCGQPTWDPQSSLQRTQLVPSSHLKKGKNTNECHVGPMFSPHMG